MAQIIKRAAANGTYRYDVRTRIDGRVVTKTFTRRKDADNYSNTIEADKLRGVAIDPRAGATTFQAYSTQWMEQRVDLRPRTAEDYRNLLRVHLEPAFGATSLARITPASVRQWNAELAVRSPGRAPKAYRFLRTILNTAVADQLIVRNPCQVKGAAQDRSTERAIPTVAEVQALADAMPARLSLVVLLAAWCGLRRGEILALRRRDVDLVHEAVRIERTVHQLRNGSLVFGPPKTDAGRRTVHYSSNLVDPVKRHLAEEVAADPDSLLFTGAKGGPLRPHVLQGHWNTARTTVAVRYRLHDLRHLGATLAATTGASTKELMRRLGHASPQAAMIYQHATEDRDKAIAAALAKLAPKATVTRLRPRDGRAKGNSVG